MALIDAIKSGVAAAFNVVSSLETSISLVKNTSNPSYNPTTGAVTASTSTQAFNAIMTRYERNEVDGSNVLSTDAKIIVPQTRITGTPLTTDTLTIASVTWDIKNVVPDPANATWTIQARRA